MRRHNHLRAEKERPKVVTTGSNHARKPTNPLIQLTPSHAKSQKPPTNCSSWVSLSAYFAWLMSKGKMEVNPALGITKAVENGERKDVITGDELVAIWHALGTDPSSVIVKLLLLLGLRRDEIGCLAWSEIDFKRNLIVLPGAKTKNKREHVVPLPPAALALLEAQPRRFDPDGSPRDLVFGHTNYGWQNWSSPKKVLDANLQTPVRPWRLHDLRRVMATTMADELNVDPHVIECLLGHVGSRKGVAGIYNRASYLTQQRRALERWESYVQDLVQGVSVVTSLQRA